MNFKGTLFERPTYPVVECYFCILLFRLEKKKRAKSKSKKGQKKVLTGFSIKGLVFTVVSFKFRWKKKSKKTLIE